MIHENAFNVQNKATKSEEAETEKTASSSKKLFFLKRERWQRTLLLLLHKIFLKLRSKANRKKASVSPKVSGIHVQPAVRLCCLDSQSVYCYCQCYCYYNACLLVPLIYFFLHGDLNLY